MTRAVIRKAVKLDHHHFDRDPSDPSFNIDAARAAHSDVMRRWDDPVEGDDFKAMILHTVQNMTAIEIEKHRGEIQAFLDEFGAKQKDDLSKAIVKSYVQNAFGAAEEFGKERKWDESKWKRNHGEFSRYLGGLTPVRGPEAPAQAGEHGYGSTYDQHMHQQALMSQAARIAEAAGGKQQKVMWQFEDKKGNVRTQMHRPGQIPKTKRGEKLLGPRGEGIKGNDLSMNDVGFNLIQALGSPTARARRIVNTTDQVGRMGGQFTNEWNNYAHQNYGTDTGHAYKRIKAGADVLHAVAGASPKAQVAVAVGRFVGDHGQSAEKVIGPHARKTSYKYRGVERTPRLGESLQNKPASMDQETYHDALVGKIAGHIPTSGVHALNLASGYTAPSHGYLLNEKGKVISEAHGYGDDHYLPFKLGGLTRMKGGSYIRTRATGGPTTEDIYAASVSGGKQFTVTSRQGTYEVGFDKDFTHNKRFGDIALGMSKRYGKILDAVDSGKVTVKGEVTNRQYQDWVQDGLAMHKDDPNAMAKAHEYAESQAQQMESADGLKLTLDGNGYDYALKSLKSQYPYYISDVKYTRPGDQRFWNTEGEGHLARVGNASEKDTGYVKPKHIKSADALVGYFDTSIIGEANRLGNDPASINNSGKIRGDVAHYANWKHNAYRNTPRAAQPGQGAGQGARPHQGPTANGVASNAVQQGNQLRNTGQGNGKVNPFTGMDGHQERLLNMAREVVAYREKHNQTPPADLNQWAKGDPVEFLAAHKENPAKVEAKIVEAHAKVDGRGTNTPIHQHADEQVDSVHNAAETSRMSNERKGIEDYLDTETNNNLRETLSNAADELFHTEPGGHPDEAAADPDSWGNYHYVERDKLMAHAFPPGTPDRKNLMDRANKMMDAETQLEELEEEHGVLDVDRWMPGAKGSEGEDTSAVEADVSRNDPDVLRAQHAQNMSKVLDQALDEHNTWKPSPGDADETRLWRTAKSRLSNLQAAWDDNPEPDEATFQENNTELKHLIKDYPEMGDIIVRNPMGGGHREMTLREMLISHEPVGKQSSATPVVKSARYVIAKRSGGHYTIRKVA